MCILVYTMYVKVSQEARRGLDLYCGAAGIQIQVLWESSKCSLLLSLSFKFRPGQLV